MGIRRPSRAVSPPGIVMVVGRIWEGMDAAAVLLVAAADIPSVLGAGGDFSREAIEDWLEEHGSDFAEITDFCASADLGGRTVEIDWEDPDSEDFYAECMYGEPE
jgi:hypothetical protein